MCADRKSHPGVAYEPNVRSRVLSEAEDVQQAYGYSLRRSLQVSATRNRVHVRSAYRWKVAAAQQRQFSREFRSSGRPKKITGVILLLLAVYMSKLC